MHETIYQPHEDSYLMQKTLIKFLNSIKDNSIKILDMGSGSGIQALTCKKLGFKNILTADINQEAIKHLKKLGFKSIKSNLFNNINKNNKYDLIIFNSPYLPFDKREPKDSRLQTTGGKKGYEITVRFLKEARGYLSNEGVVLLLFSSLSKHEVILKKAFKLGYNERLLDKEKLFFEELFVYKLRCYIKSPKQYSFEPF